MEIVSASLDLAACGLLGDTSRLITKNILTDCGKRSWQFKNWSM